MGAGVFGGEIEENRGGLVGSVGVAARREDAVG